MLAGVVLANAYRYDAQAALLPRVWWPWLETGGAAGLWNAAAVTALMLLFTALASRYGLKLKF